MKFSKQQIIGFCITVALVVAGFLLPLYFWFGFFIGFVAGLLIIVFYGKWVVAILTMLNIQYEKEVENYVDDRLNKQPNRKTIRR